MVYQAEIVRNEAHSANLEAQHMRGDTGGLTLLHQLQWHCVFTTLCQALVTAVQLLDSTFGALKGQVVQVVHAKVGKGQQGTIVAMGLSPGNPAHGLFCCSVNLNVGWKLHWVLNAICWLALPIAKSLNKRTPRRVSLYSQVLYEGPALKHCKSRAGFYAAGYDICM